MATRPETRSKTQNPPLTEAELEHMRKNLCEQEARLREQNDAVRRDRNQLEADIQKFRAEQATAERNFESIRTTLLEKESELSKKISNAPDTDFDSIRIINQDAANELPKPHQEVDYTRHGTNLPFSTSPFPTSGFIHGIEQTSRIALREALEIVPHFDGSNIPLSQFTQACRRAKHVVPITHERDLTRLLVNRLRGRAYCAIGESPCDSVLQLIDRLHNAFGPTKSVDEYRGELSSIYLKPHEHILDYIMKVQDIRNLLLDAERRTNGRADPPTIANIDALTARSFCKGLPPEIRTQLQPEHYLNPFEAFSRATDISNECARDRERFGTGLRHETQPSRAPVRQIGPPMARSTPKRSEYGQWREYSRNPTDNYRQSPSPTGYPSRANNFPRTESFASWRNNTQFSGARENRPESRSSAPRGSGQPKWCRYCKNPGHEIEECRKRAYNNSRQESGNSQRPSGTSDEPRAGASRERTRPVRVIDEENNDTSDSQS